ncbi:MAG: prepilin peptidase [Ruminococcus sp.]|nr:prepilin peptidase [Ruminococcus sp.]
MQITEYLIEGMAFVFLCVCAVFDICKKEIPTILIGLGIMAASGVGVWRMLNGTLTFGETGACLLPGIFFLLISFFTKEKMGSGDGLMLLAVGLFTGFYHCLFILCISLVFSSVTALVLLLIHKVGKESRIPFAPFLALGMGVGFFVREI